MTAELRPPHSAYRLLRRHEGESGLILYGWFVRYRYRPEPAGWGTVLVRVEAEIVAAINKLKRAPCWLPLLPEPQLIELLDGQFRPKVVHRQRYVVGVNLVFFVGVRPPRRSRGESEPLWCTSTMRG